MALASTTRRNDYAGNGSVGSYSYTFKIFAKTELRVVVEKASDGTKYVPVLDTDFSVFGVGSVSGGLITFIDLGQAYISSGKLKTGYNLTILGAAPLTQTRDLRNQGDFYPATYEDALDKTAMIDQQQQEQLDRSMKLDESLPASSFSTTIPPVPPAGGILSVKNDQSGFEWGTTVPNLAAAGTNAAAAAASASQAAASATAASGSATNAASSATSASSSASGASTSATSAASSASAASTSATNAASSASAAASSASSASTSATNAAASAASAAAAANGALRPATTKTSNYTVNPATDYDIYVDASSGDVLITAPAAGTNEKYEFRVTRIDSSTHQVKVASTDLMNGVNQWSLTDQYDVYAFKAHGGTFYVS